MIMDSFETENSPIIIPPLTTFFREDGSADIGAHLAHLQILYDAGIRRVFLLSTTGESPYIGQNAELRASLTREVLKLAKGKGDMEVLVGLTPGEIGNYQQLIDEANRRIGDGAYGVVVTTPIREGIIFPDGMFDNFFHPLISGIDGNVVLYNLPSVYHPLGIDDIGMLADAHSNLVAVKNSSSFGLTKSCVERYGQRGAKRLQIYHGNELEAVDALLFGADGLVPSLANLNPGLFLYIANNLRDGGIPAMQHDVDMGVELVYPGQENVPASLKTAIHNRHHIGNVADNDLGVEQAITHRNTPIEIISPAEARRIVAYSQR